MKIGIVDLDTSHPASWVPIERELGHEVVGVWDGGSVHPKGYVDTFAAEHRIPRVFGSLAEMVREVDAAIIHGCDWDTHVMKARPFVEAGKAVMVDKPLAGNVRDLRQLAEWARRGARITGGSALRFCREVRQWFDKPVAERGTPHTVVCGCAVDDFNYGIHAYAMLSGIMGPGMVSVRHLGANVQRRIEVMWADGRTGLLIIGKQGAWLPFHATLVTEKSVTHIPGTQNLYRAVLEATLPYLAGQTDQPPLPFDALMEPELAALAARQSWTDGNREVRLDQAGTWSSGYDGAAFAAEYRKTKGL